MTPSPEEPSFADQAREALDAQWTRIPAEPVNAEVDIPDAIRQAIGRCIDSRTKSYRYVLPTHLLAKWTRAEIDARCVQDSSGLQAAFDARSFCRATIVPFDRANHNVLGGSTDPYVSNPLRIPAITAEQRPAQRDQEGFQDLIDVLDYAQHNPGAVEALLNGVLEAIRDRLQRVHITYPTPSRASLNDVWRVTQELLHDRTGGRRLQAVAVALFRTIGSCFGLFDRVESGHVNASDVRTGHAADLTCVSEDGSVAMAVEVKDRQLAVREVEDKLPQIRETNVQELLYVIRGGVASQDAPRFEQLVAGQFRSGHNIYACEFDELLRVALMLFGEAGRRDMLERIGAALDEFGDLRDRETWRQLLDSI